MDMSEKYLNYAEEAFRRHGATDRISTIKGPCLEMFVLVPNSRSVALRKNYLSRKIDRLPTLTGQFDLIYIDAAEEEYEAYTRYILDNKLLSPRGVILVDDGGFQEIVRQVLILICWIVLLEGLVVDRSIAKAFPADIQEPYLAIADKMNAFNSYAASEPRVTTIMIPIFNGVTQIMWK
jgi:caffeoyl-CoA O-methyltransferase